MFLFHDVLWVGYWPHFLSGDRLIQEVLTYSYILISFSSINVRVSGLILMPLIHLELIFFFCASWELRIQFHSFTRGYPFSSALFVKEAVFPLWIFLASLSKIRRLYLRGFGSGSVALFHWFICLVLCQYRAVSVIMAMKYNLKSGIRWAGQPYQLGFFFFFFRIAFTIQGFFFFFYFQVNFKAFFFFCLCEECCWNFHGDCIENVNSLWYYRHFHSIDSFKRYALEIFFFSLLASSSVSLLVF